MAKSKFFCFFGYRIIKKFNIVLASGKWITAITYSTTIMIRKYLNIIVAILLFFSYCKSLNAEEVTIANTKYSSPKRALLNIYMFDINTLNLMEGNCEMIFYMGLYSKDCNDIHLEFMNGEVISQEVVTDRSDYKLYRIRAILNQNLNYRRYPFERHILKICIEDKFLNIENLIFQVNKKYSGLDDAIILPGWSEEPDWSAQVSNHYYSNFNETYSRYTFSIIVKRPIVAGILKNIIPAIFIMLIGFLTLFYDTYKAVNALTISSGALVSLVLLHLAMVSSLPSNDYVTFLDSFMIINYLSLLMLIAETITIMNQSIFFVSYPLFKLFRHLTPVLWFLLQIFNSVYYFLVLH